MVRTLFGEIRAFLGGPVSKWFLMYVPSMPPTPLYDCMRPFPQYLWTT